VYDGDQRSERHHLAFLRAHVESLDVVRPFAVLRFGRHQHLPGAAVLVEVVDVVGAKGRRQRREDLVDRNPRLFHLLAVDVHEQLRNGRAPQGLCAAEQRVAVSARQELLQYFLQAFWTAVAAVLDEELVSARGAETENRRWIERQHQRFLDSCGLHEQLANELLRGGLAFVPRLLGHEQRCRVVAEAATDEVEAGKSNDVLVCRVAAHRGFNLFDNLGGALQRRAVGQNHRADEEALVLVGHQR